MGLKKTIGSAVDTAFSVLSDLVKTGVLTGSSGESFDFETKTLVTSINSFTVDFLELTSKVLEDGSVEKELLFKSEGLSPSLYSTLVYSGTTFRFKSVEDYGSAFVIKVRGQ